MSEVGGPSARLREREPSGMPVARRVGSWVIWWVLLMSLWVIVDDSTATDELLAGAGAAALAATLAELVGYQTTTRFRMRIEWLVPAFSLPGQIASDVITVFAALWRQLVSGKAPPSGFRALPVRFGEDTAEGETRRFLRVAAESLAPNTFALGMDKERDLMFVHQLVVNKGEPAE